MIGSLASSAISAWRRATKLLVIVAVTTDRKASPPSSRNVATSRPAVLAGTMSP